MPAVNDFFSETETENFPWLCWYTKYVAEMFVVH